MQKKQKYAENKPQLAKAVRKKRRWAAKKKEADSKKTKGGCKKNKGGQEIKQRWTAK